MTTAAGWTSCSGLGQLQHRIQQTPDTITCKYDPGGRRIKKTVDGFSTQYLYDGGNVIAEYDGNGNILRKYIYGPRVDEPLCMIEVANSIAIPIENSRLCADNGPYNNSL